MTVVKIAPGPGARYWKDSDCLEKGHTHICIGWGKVGDLRNFNSEDELQAAVNRHHYHGRAPGTASKTAWQLWALRNLESGDKVIANKGNSIVLRVGTVTGPYRWNAKHHYPHTVPVDWGKSRERQKIPPQEKWNNNTVSDEVSAALYKLITGKRLPKDAAVDNGSEKPAVSRRELAVLGRLDEERRVLTRKEQAFLRKYLLGGNDYGRCFLCGEKLRAELLVTAHIKARAKCSEKERRDLANIVPMCILGCDALFERGHLAVVDNRLDARLDDPIRGSRLGTILKTLRRRRVSVETRQRKYFEWHSKHS